MSLLEIRDVTLWYESVFGDIRALDRCSLDIEQGGINCLLGINGAGKTSLFRTVSGLIKDYDGRLTRGEIVFRGEDITRLSSSIIVSKGIGHAPQDRHVFFTLPVLDNLLLGAYIRRKGRGAKERIDRDMQRLFNLFPVFKDRLGQKAGTLSGGEQQMLSIGRALMAGPRLLILDEPLLGLAPIVSGEILGALCELRDEGLTLLLGEQNADEVLKVADRGAVLDNGFIVSVGMPSELEVESRIYSGRYR